MKKTILILLGVLIFLAGFVMALISGFHIKFGCLCEGDVPTLVSPLSSSYTPEEINKIVEEYRIENCPCYLNNKFSLKNIHFYRD